MALLDLCLGGTPNQASADKDIIAIGKRVDDQIRLIDRAIADLKTNIFADCDKRIDEVAKVVKDIHTSIRLQLDHFIGTVRTDLKIIRDSISVQQQMQQEELLLQLRLIGIPMLDRDALDGGKGRERVTKNGGIGDAGDIGIPVLVKPTRQNNGTNGDRTDEPNKPNGGTGQEDGIPVYREPIRPVERGDGDTDKTKRFIVEIPKGDTLLVRKSDGGIVPVDITLDIDSANCDKPIVTLTPRPDGGGGGVAGDDDEGIPILVRPRENGGLPTGGNGQDKQREDLPDKDNGECPVFSLFPSFEAYVTQNAGDVSQVCEQNPQLLLQLAQTFADEKAQQQAIEAQRTNPVGIEQPGSFRFQQRQQPWFRDYIAWGGKEAEDYANAQSLESYLQELQNRANERLRGTLEE